MRRSFRPTVWRNGVAALVMLEQLPGGYRVTVGADKGYDTRGFVSECRHLNVTPQVAMNTGGAWR
jgi:hypothetical protein